MAPTATPAIISEKTVPGFVKLSVVATRGQLAESTTRHTFGSKSGDKLGVRNL
jgi:hypothetical protein